MICEIVNAYYDGLGDVNSTPEELALIEAERQSALRWLMRFRDGEAVAEQQSMEVEALREIAELPVEHANEWTREMQRLARRALRDIEQAATDGEAG